GLYRCVPWVHTIIRPYSRTPAGHAASQTLVIPSHGQLAVSWGGKVAADAHYVTARYETPVSPILPVDHVLSAAHAIKSWVSAPSWGPNRSPTPSERPQPRRSALMTTYPRGTQ